MAIIVKKHQISMWGLVMLTLGNIVNSMGIAVVAGDGYSGILIFLVACVFFSLPCLIISNFLATHFKHDGGLYHWIQQAYGQKTALLGTWLAWISVIVSFPAFMTFNVGLLAYSMDMPWLSTNKVYIAATSIFFVWVFTWLVSKGVRGTIKMSAFNTIFSYVFPLGLLFILAIIWLIYGSPTTHTPLTYHNVFPSSSELSVLALLGTAVFMVAGLELSGYFVNYVKNSSIYKKGMFIAFGVITVAPIIAIFSMLTLIPLSKLSDSNGLMQAFHFVFNWLGFHAGSNIVLFLYFIGQMMAIATILIFGVKSMEAVTLDGVLPERLLKQNKHGISYKLMIIQAVVISLLIGAFTLMPSLSSAYALITVIVGIASVIRYVILFSAAGKILKSLPQTKILRSIIWCSMIGGLFSIVTFALSFIPPVQNDMTTLQYEVLLISGVIITVFLPLCYFLFKKSALKQS